MLSTLEGVYLLDSDGDSWTIALVYCISKASSTSAKGRMEQDSFRATREHFREDRQ